MSLNFKELAPICDVIDGGLCNPLILAVLNGFFEEMRVLETYSAIATAVLAQNLTNVAKIARRNRC